MNVERQPLDAVAKQKTAFESKVSAFGTLKSSLSTFQTAISSLSDPAKFNAQAVTSGDTKVFTATANGQGDKWYFQRHCDTVSQGAKIDNGWCC